MAATILTFSLAREKDNQVKKICQKLGIIKKDVLSSDYHKTLGALAGVPVIANTSLKTVGISATGNTPGLPLSANSTGKAQGFPFALNSVPGEMLVMSGLSSELMDQFLAAYRETGLEPIACKAIVTPINAGWTPGQLYAELLKEHAAMHGK